jgi:hypothetical protein
MYGGEEEEKREKKRRKEGAINVSRHAPSQPTADGFFPLRSVPPPVCFVYLQFLSPCGRRLRGNGGNGSSLPFSFCRSLDSSLASGEW